MFRQSCGRQKPRSLQLASYEFFGKSDSCKWCGCMLLLSAGWAHEVDAEYWMQRAIIFFHVYFLHVTMQNIVQSNIVCNTAAVVLSFECFTARQYDQYQYKSSLLKLPATSNLQWVDSLSCPNLKTFRQSLRSVSLAQQAQYAGFL